MDLNDVHIVCNSRIKIERANTANDRKLKSQWSVRVVELYAVWLWDKSAKKFSRSPHTKF